MFAKWPGPLSYANGALHAELGCAARWRVKEALDGNQTNLPAFNRRRYTYLSNVAMLSMLTASWLIGAGRTVGSACIGHKHRSIALVGHAADADHRHTFSLGYVLLTKSILQ